jgi:hypothetical protein
MESVLSAQLDFVLFFYGLAFILLGVVCFSATGARAQLVFSRWLGSFAVLHGLGEWLDMTALLVGDGPAFAWVRTAIMTSSFLLLMEFARLNARQFGRRVPDRGWYLPVILVLAAFSLTATPASVNAVARYATGLLGGLAAAWVFARHARGSSGFQRRLLLLVAVEMACYAVAAGAIVPRAPFWPASAFNYPWFAHVAGMPIQIVRGTLACGMALSIWGIWNVSSR